jgi:glucose-1-phosphate thymidylyltransferase
MKVILPVAGKGTRLRPHTHTKAKSLVHVAGKTVLEHIIGRLAHLQVEEFIFITDEHGEQIAEQMKKSFPQLTCRYVAQKERLGPAHAVLLAAPYLSPGDDLLIVFNDTIFVADLGRIPELAKGYDGLIYSHLVEDYQRFGVNVVKDGIIVDMVEKPATPISRLAQVGLYYLRDGVRFMNYIQASVDAGDTVKGEYYLPAVFMRMIHDNMTFSAPEIDAWLDCGKPETLLETNRYLLNGRHHCHGEAVNSVLIAPVHIAEGALVRNSILGPNVSVAAGSIISGSIIRDSIINLDSEVTGMLLNGSILGDSVRLSSTARKMNIGDHSIIEMEG